jgi:hypothetical protein
MQYAIVFLSNHRGSEVVVAPEMSIAAEHLPLPRRDGK